MTSLSNTQSSRSTSSTKGWKSRDTKKTRLIRLLSAKAGADVAAISSKLGWQAHTTRAAITGLKKAGYEVRAEKPSRDEPTRYRIVVRPKAASAASSQWETVHAG
jgi:hypothetical protein